MNRGKRSVPKPAADETVAISTKTEVSFRQPEIKDGQAIHTLITNSPPLDVNSGYAYLLLCHHFPDTCVVAEADGELVGFVSAYIPPRQPNTLFVWQVVVAEAGRGQGLAGRMIEQILDREICSSVQFIETTVSPSNRASQRLFQKLADKLGVGLEKNLLFASTLFEGQQHEDEVLHKLGPLHRDTVTS